MYACMYVWLCMHGYVCMAMYVFFLVSYVGERPWNGLYNALTKEERGKRKAKRRERSDQVY